MTASASAATTSSWYWTAGACKSESQTHGVEIGDGRWFNVAKAFCVGLHDHCWQDMGRRRYKIFETVMRSYDGVVRYMRLTVSGKHTWTGARMRILERYMPVDRFYSSYGGAAWTIAANENRGGCCDLYG